MTIKGHGVDDPANTPKWVFEYPTTEDYGGFGTGLFSYAQSFKPYILRKVNPDSDAYRQENFKEELSEKLSGSFDDMFTEYLAPKEDVLEDVFQEIAENVVANKIDQVDYQREDAYIDVTDKMPDMLIYKPDDAEIIELPVISVKARDNGISIFPKNTAL